MLSVYVVQLECSKVGRLAQVAEKSQCCLALCGYFGQSPAASVAKKAWLLPVWVIPPVRVLG